MFRKILPPRGPAGLLAVSQLVNSFGDGAYYVCSVLYFTQIVKLSPAQVGLGLTIGWGIGFLAGVPLGHLADRYGPRGVSVALAAATGLSIASFVLIHSFPAFLVAACAYAVAQSGLAAVRQALLAAVVDRGDRTSVRAYLQSATNAGLSVGAGLGGLALEFGTASAYLSVFLFDAASFLVSAVVLAKLPQVPPSAPAGDGERKLAVLSDTPYALATFLNMIMLLRMPIISLAIPLWIVQRTHAPGWMVSAVLVLNTVAVMLFQVRIARRVTDLGTAARLVAQSGVVLIAACAVFPLSGVWPGAWPSSILLLAASALLVLGEMMQSSGSWEISFELAPPDRHGQYQGFYGTGVAVARMFGPLLLTTLVIDWGTPGWLLLGLLFLASGLASGPATRWAVRRRPNPVSPPEPARPGTAA